MERLTLERAICRVKMVAKNQRWNSKYTKVSPMNEKLNKRHEADYIKDAEEHEQLAEWLEELKSYKEAEEQGLLVRLPCKVGDILFRINKGARNPIIKMKVSQITMTSKSYNIKAIEEDYGEVFFSDDVIGIKVFLTREEAKKKLDEMKKND